jgi:hypothetical protein
MKKLLVLMLVLGMTSLASAAISLDGPTSITVGDTVKIGIDNLDGGDYLAYVNVSLISEAGFSMSAPALTSLAGNQSSVGAPYVYGDGSEIEITLADTVGVTTPGVQFTWDLTCLAQDVTVTVLLWDAADLSAPVDVLTIAQVPEPMTIALLGFGGLFLLRHRK